MYQKDKKLQRECQTVFKMKIEQESYDYKIQENTETTDRKMQIYRQRKPHLMFANLLKGRFEGFSLKDSLDAS